MAVVNKIKDKTLSTMAKKGRKPKSETEKMYFSEVQENAVKEYLKTDSVERRNEIFNGILKPAFTKMIESIIRRYKLFVPEEEFDETFNDIMSFLSTKMDKYDPEKHHKAYSYYGTICKNQLIYKINQFKKKIERNEPYDDTYEKFQNSIDYSTNTDSNTLASDLTSGIAKKIDEMMNDSSIHLSDNERKVGSVLCELFNNWEGILTDDGSNKLNKSKVLYYLRENTLLSTKEVRDNMKKYKFAYYELKKKMIEDL